MQLIKLKGKGSYVCIFIRGLLVIVFFSSVHRGVWCKFLHYSLWALDVNVPYGGPCGQQTRVGDVCCVELGVSSG